MKRYGNDERISDSYKNLAEIDWLIFDPHEANAGRAVIGAATEHLTSWGVREWGADGNLPCLGVYGIPDAWPHVEQLLREAGFHDEGGQIEIVFAGDLATIDRPGPAPIEHLSLRRVVGPLGTSFEAVFDGKVIGLSRLRTSTARRMRH